MKLASLFDSDRRKAIQRSVSRDEPLPSRAKKAWPELVLPVFEPPTYIPQNNDDLPLITPPPAAPPQPPQAQQPNLHHAQFFPIQPAPPAPAAPAQPPRIPPAMPRPKPQLPFNPVQKPATNPGQSNADLLEAICKGDDKKVAEAIAKGADVNLPDPNGTTPLMVASKYGYPAIIWMLKGFRADMNAQDNLGRTALIYAVLKQQPKSASMLIQAGADTSIADNDGRTPVHAAILKSDHGMLQLLLEAGAPVDVWDKNHETPLITAIQVDAGNRVPFLVPEILARKPDLSTKDGQGYTALIHAIKAKNPKLVSMVLEAGADPNQAGLSGMGPLEYAKKEGTFQIRMQVWWKGGR